MSPRRAVPALALSSALALAAGSAATAGPAPATAVPGPSDYLPSRIISGPSYPALSAWGIAHNPVTNEILVGDYLTSQVRRFTREGVYLGDLVNPGDTISGVASGLAVDPRDGAIYLALTGQGRVFDVAKYDKSGNFLYGLDIPLETTWLTVDKNGFLWVPSAFRGGRVTRYRVDDATRTATAVVTIAKKGSGPGRFGMLTGIAVDAANNAYIVDTGHKVVHVYSPKGVWKFDFGTGVLSSDIRGIAIDPATGNVFVAQSGLGTIEVFDKTGKHLRTFAGPGTGPGQFGDGARQIATTPDGQLYAADYGLQRVLKFTTAGEFVQAFPEPPQPMDKGGLAQARGLAVDPTDGSLVTVDAWGQRMLRFGADGTLLDAQGRRGSTAPDGMNYPKGITVDTSGTVWVANYEGAPFLVGYSPALDSLVKVIKTPRFINDVEYSADGYLYAVERHPGALRVYDRSTGKQVRSWTSTVGWLRGVAVDAASRNVWLTSDTKNEMYVLSPSGTIIKTIPLTGLGWGIAIRRDYVYVANTTAHTVQVFDKRTYASLGTIGTKGAGFGQVNTPSGVALDSKDNLYVMDMLNGRVDVFAPNPAPSAETVPPAMSVFSGTGVVDGQVRVGGYVSDASGIATIGVRVQDTQTGKYFNGLLSTWVSAPYANAGIYWGSDSASTWRYTLPATIPGHTYAVSAYAVDRRGNTSTTVTKTVEVPLTGIRSGRR